MDWSAVGAIAELAGAAGVVASLLYVGRQVQLNARSVRTASHESAVNAVRDVSIAIWADSEISRVFTLGVRDPAALDPDQLSRFRYIVYNFLKAFEDVHFHFSEGDLPSETWEGFRTLLATYVGAPGVREFFDERGPYYSERFRQLVAELQEEGGLVL